jgi:hypothetical protein
MAKTFICHSSEDKDRFVIRFAERLRSNGIDAWIDKWEMVPGDILVDKIFESGIQYSNCFIIVLSKSSTQKKWVKEELNAAFMKRIEGKIRIIPVIIEECEIPECLKSTVWIKIIDIQKYDEEYKMIENAILGVSDKPELGELPKYAKGIDPIIPRLTKLDNSIFVEMCRWAIIHSRPFVQVSSILDVLYGNGISNADIEETLEILHTEGYIELSKMRPLELWHAKITIYGMEEYLNLFFEKYEEIKKSIMFLIINENVLENLQLQDRIKQSIIIIDHILELLKQNGLLDTVSFLGGRTLITNVSPKMKRILNI